MDNTVPDMLFLTEDVSNYCGELLKKGKISEEDKELFITAAARIQAEKTKTASSTQTAAGYTYSQEGYFCRLFVHRHREWHCPA